MLRDVDWFGVVVYALVAAMVGVFGWLIYALLDEHIHCTRYEQQYRWHAAHTTFIHSGKVMIPIHHPGYYGWDDVCIERDDTPKRKGKRKP